MRKRVGLAALLVCVLIGATALAQGPGMRHYDPATVETLRGTVEEVRIMKMPGQRGGGVHLTVDTGKETLDVHLGPQFYLAGNDFFVEPGQQVEVTGSRVEMGGRPALIARRIALDDQQLELRDETGKPRWSGQGPGMGGKMEMMQGRGMMTGPQGEKPMEGRCPCQCGCGCGHHHHHHRCPQPER